jgi:(2Fe-2S) ferredoxin
VKHYRLAVCKGPDCRNGGADQVFAACRELVAKAGLASRCEVSRGGCYGLCHLGPNLVLREGKAASKDPLSPENFQLLGKPGEFHYHAMNMFKLALVVHEHVGRERVLEELLCRPQPESAAKQG